MDPHLRLDALVAPLRADVVSGAAMVARKACEVVRRAAGRVPAHSVPELRAALADLAVLILDAQPAMAPLVALMSQVLDALADAPDAEEGRRSVRAAADAFRDALEARAQAVAARVGTLLPRDGDILTLSSSSTVRAALLHDARLRRGRVVVLESRPMQEGRLLAAELARAGLPVLFAVDAAGAALVPRCAMVLLGADSVGDAGVVNKLGSVAAVHAARRAAIPVMVAADTTKILPPGFPQHLADDRPGREVWEAPPGVRVWNRYFEAVPLADVGPVVTENAALTPDEVEQHRTSIRVPDEVRAWGALRAGGRPDPPVG